MEVVILCGGKGTRAYPYTQYFPKVMMPICGTPILVHLMRIYAEQGFTDFVLASGYQREILEDYFHGRYSEWNTRIVDTGVDADTGERLRRCAPYVGKTFFATYGDGLGNIDLDQLLRFHKDTGGLATVTAVPLRTQYGTVVFNGNGKVDRFNEKPIIPDYWINAGFFVFERDVFGVWEGQNLEVEVLPNLASRGLMYSYVHQGFWKSMDTGKDQQDLEKILNSNGRRAPWTVALERRNSSVATLNEG